MPMSINRSKASGAVLAPDGGVRASAVGVTITFKTVGAVSGGQFLTLEYVAPPHFSGPPPHWHKVTTEIFYVLHRRCSDCGFAQYTLGERAGWPCAQEGEVQDWSGACT